MPTSRSGACTVEYWVDGSRRDATVEDFYNMGPELGRGATSVVFRCEEKQTEKPYAVKVLKKTIDKKIVRTEIGVLLRLSHPNIIRLKEIFETETEIFLILELVTGGELFDRIVERGYYSERDAAHVIKQILEAVAYLHENGVVHRDLKPENLLYADLSIDAPLKIADFGLSKIIDEQVTMKTVCGTPGYCAPEILRGNAYGPEVDMWSVGVILYILTLRSRRSLFEEGGSVRAPRGSGPASVEAERRLQSWGSQMDLTEGFETGSALSQPSPVRSSASVPGSEARAAVSSAQAEVPILQLSSSEELDVVSFGTGDTEDSSPQSPASEE
ncbi:unnamed protein product [Leuciscus chuanchicus]